MHDHGLASGGSPPSRPVNLLGEEQVDTMYRETQVISKCRDEEVEHKEIGLHHNAEQVTHYQNY